MFEIGSKDYQQVSPWRNLVDVDFFVESAEKSFPVGAVFEVTIKKEKNYFVGGIGTGLQDGKKVPVVYQLSKLHSKNDFGFRFVAKKDVERQLEEDGYALEEKGWTWHDDFYDEQIRLGKKTRAYMSFEDAVDGCNHINIRNVVGSAAEAEEYNNPNTYGESEIFAEKCEQINNLNKKPQSGMQRK